MRPESGLTHKTPHNHQIESSGAEVGEQLLAPMDDDDDAKEDEAVINDEEDVETYF